MTAADRAGMRLYLVDFHLESCRLLIAENRPDPAREHLETAGGLIRETGYHRRDRDVEECKTVMVDRFG